MKTQKEKIKLTDIFNRNLVLILLIQIFSDMNVNMVGSFINMGAKAAGIGVAAIGIAASAYSIGGLIVRMPAGTLANSDKKRIALIGTMVLRSITQLILGTIGIHADMNFVIARALYGIGWSFVGIVLPAIVAMMMDKKVMGTTYAVLAIFQQFTKDMIKALGVKIYQDQGMTTALVVAIGLTVVAMILVMFLDFNDSRIIEATPKTRQSGLKAINLRYAPICLLLSIAVFSWTLCNNYNNVLAQDRSIDIASILAITSIVSSVASFFASAICDFIHPKYVLVVLYLCLGGGCFVLGGAESYSVFLIGQLLCTIGMTYSRTISVFLFKNCAVTEKATVHATNYLMTDILSIMAGAIIGALLAGIDYKGTYTVMAATTVVAAILVLFFSDKLMHFHEKTEEEA